MLVRFGLVMACLVVLVCSGMALAQNPTAPTTTQTTNQAADISGAWTGTWGVYSPAQGTTPPKDICKRLDAKVEFKDGVWLATFEGDCGRPYKYNMWDPLESTCRHASLSIL